MTKNQSKKNSPKKVTSKSLFKEFIDYDSNTSKKISINKNYVAYYEEYYIKEKNPDRGDVTRIELTSGASIYVEASYEEVKKWLNNE